MVHSPQVNNTGPSPVQNRLSVNQALRPTLGMLFKCSGFLPRKVLLLIYNSFINSKISYCLEFWGNAGKTYMDQIYLLQERLVRIIYKQSTTAHTKPLFLESSVLPVHLLIKLLLIAYKTFYSTQTHSHHNYLTRASQHNLQLPSSITAAGHRRVSYQCASLWNGLPGWICAIEVEEGFKHALRQHLLDLL